MADGTGGAVDMASNVFPSSAEWKLDDEESDIAVSNCTKRVHKTNLKSGDEQIIRLLLRKRL
jgi:hypothetical protein